MAKWCYQLTNIPTQCCSQYFHLQETFQQEIGFCPKVYGQQKNNSDNYNNSGVKEERFTFPDEFSCSVVAGSVCALLSL